MKTKSLTVLLSAGVLSAVGAVSQAGTLTFQTYTTDAATGIDPAAETYTHAIDLNGAGGTTGKVAPPSINLLTFKDGGSGAQPTLNYTLASSASFTNNGDNTGGSAGAAAAAGIRSLLSDFFYGVQNNTLTLTGLQPSTNYTARFFVSTAFDGPTFNFSASDTGGATAASPLSSTNGLDRGSGQAAAGGEYIYNYTTDASGAGSTGITFTFASTAAGDTFHNYGFTNETVPEPASLSLLSLGALGLLARRRTNALI